MLIDDKLEREQRKARLDPYLWFVGVPIVDVLEEARQRHFPSVGERLEFLFVRKGPLVCISIAEQSATIFAHQVINRSDAPIEVFSLICKHELLHMEVPGREVDGRWTSHPPEFREREALIAPEEKTAWEWIRVHLWYCLKVRPRLERIDVTGAWRDRGKALPCPPMSGTDARVFL